MTIQKQGHKSFLGVSLTWSPKKNLKILTVSQYIPVESWLGPLDWNFAPGTANELFPQRNRSIQFDRTMKLGAWKLSVLLLAVVCYKYTGILGGSPDASLSQKVPENARLESRSTSRGLFLEGFVDGLIGQEGVYDIIVGSIADCIEFFSSYETTDPVIVVTIRKFLENFEYLISKIDGLDDILNEGACARNDGALVSHSRSWPVNVFSQSWSVPTGDVCDLCGSDGFCGKRGRYQSERF